MLHRPGVDGGRRVRVAPQVAGRGHTALTGFQSATACSHPGMCWVGTMALETKASGNRHDEAERRGRLGLLLFSPTQAAIHDSE